MTESYEEMKIKYDKLIGNWQESINKSNQDTTYEQNQLNEYKEIVDQLLEDKKKNEH